ncbi:hypothetical protein KIP88_02670 [Bradyrhizobium sp. SRL28]|uniref:hypothetical protein n=1 Tax=Bradyrhizobium sp. SRL28 TaxID=2836178 RepID=UPI001BDEB821|nr:hypothetical protein [Bradyrhizobium sp. SRL28]MBT1509394.1 hypothetical protein [Bradyrhizobium sp. SRL28]
MAIVNITVQNDADFYRTFIWQTIALVPIDLTGGVMEMMLRRNAKDDVAVMRLGSDTGEIVFTDPPAGQFTVRISQLELERMALGEFAHSNIFTRGGFKVRVWTGTLENNPGPTR